MPSVTPGRPEDAEAIVETLRSQLRAELMAATIYAGTGIVSFVRSQLERADPVMGWFVVHRSSDSLQGFAEFRLRGEVLFLNNIYVREEATGRGIGQALLAAGLTRFGGPGALALELDVFEDNSRAKRWYQGLGLTRCARRVWWLSRGSLLPGGEDCRIILPDMAEADARQSALGFSEFTLSTPRARYTVGRIGHHCFRVVHDQLLTDGAALATLHALDSRRELVCITDETIGDVPAPLIPVKRLAVSERYRASIEDVERIVSERARKVSGSATNIR